MQTLVSELATTFVDDAIELAEGLWPDYPADRHRADRAHRQGLRCRRRSGHAAVGARSLRAMTRGRQS